jgi:FkbM family methyltransferase
MAVYRRGGAPAVVRAGRRRLARLIDPDPPVVPVKKKKRKPRPVPAPLAHHAQTVSHAQALAWFERRRPGYEQMAAVLAPYLPVDGVMFDIGANIGFFTKTVGEQLGFRGTAHLFEPVPHLAELCRTTVASLPFYAQVHEFGLGESDASLNLFLAGDGNLGWNTLISERTSPDMTPVPVAIRAFDGIGIPDRPAVVKIDVEGAEYLVLRGMLSSLAQWQPRPVVLCEIGFGQNHPAWPEVLQVFEYVLKLGYRSTTLTGEPVEVADVSRTTDLLFVPTP